MIFVLLILSLELTIPEEKKDAEEETRKTLFAQDPMEVFVAGKLEIANSHTTMTKEELSDLYLEDGAEYFKIDKEDLPPTIIDEGAINTNQRNDLNSSPQNDPKSVANKGQDAKGQTPANATGQDPAATPATEDPANSKEPEDPLKNAFKWFGEQQNANGSWDEKHQHGISGLVVMAYLAYRERTGNPEFDDALLNGLEFLIQDENCKPGADKFAYQNGIKTLALTEAARVLGTSAELEKAIKDSVTFIVVGQQDKGGFQYGYNTKTKTQDLSVAAWNLLAMHSAGKLYDIDVAKEGVEKAKEWLTAMSEKQFTYNTKNHEPSENPKESKKDSMRAIGTWLTIVLNKDNLENIKDELETIATVNYENLSWSAKNDHPLYGWNYATMSMMAAGGSAKEKWKTKLSELLLENQTAAGYWSPLNYRHGSKPIYTTAFCAQMLALVYDYKNAAYNGPPKGVSLSGAESQAPAAMAQTKETAQAPSENKVSQEAAPENKTAEETSPTVAKVPQENSETKLADLESSEDGKVAGDFDNLISLDKSKAQEIKKRLNVFRRSIKSDPEIRKSLEEKDLEILNEAIVKSLNKKFFLEAQLNKMSKDPYIHDPELLKDRYIFLNKEVTKLMKKINLYEQDNSNELALTPINIFVSSKELDIQLSDGQSLRFSTTVDGLKDFQAWLQGKDPLKDVLMINIKPSGVVAFRKIDNFIELLNFKNLTSPVDENMGTK